MEVVAFTDTNINTHIAISVSPEITTADFKREVERAHLSLFPTYGPIKALQLTVRRKRCFYHLTDSLPIKYAFRCSKRTWFLHATVHPSTICFNNPVATDSLVTHTKPANKTSTQHIRTTSDYIHGSPKAELESGLHGNDIVFRSCDSQSSVASENTTKLETICFEDQLNPLLEFTSPSNPGKPVGVGRRIVFAMTKLRVSPKPVISLYKQKLSYNVSVPRFSVFEISDSDD